MPQRGFTISLDQVPELWLHAVFVHLSVNDCPLDAFPDGGEGSAWILAKQRLQGDRAAPFRVPPPLSRPLADTCGLFPSQVDAFEDVEEVKAQLHSTSRAKASPGNRWSAKVGCFFSKKGWNEVRVVVRVVCFCKEDMPDGGMSGRKSSFSAEEWDDEERSRAEDCRPVRLCVHS